MVQGGGTPPYDQVQVPYPIVNLNTFLDIDKFVYYTQNNPQFSLNQLGTLI